MKNIYKKFLLGTFVLSLSFLSLNNLKSVHAEDIPVSTKLVKISSSGQIDWANKVIRVKGHGALPDEGGATQRRLKARIAARVDAYRNLAELINGVQVTSERNVNDFTKNDNVMTLRVDAVVKGARQSGLENALPDGSIEIELYLPLFGNGSLSSALDLGNYVRNKSSIEALMPYQVASLKDFAITEKIAENTIDKNNVTGLIIDASNFGIEPAMSPFIIAGGRIVYTGNKIQVDPENIVKYGVTDYSDSIENAKKDVERIGKNPVVIEADGAVGKPVRTNILLDEVTVKQLMDANQKTGFLNNLGVVIVI